MSFAGNPKAPKQNPSDAPQEPVGAVASDSLAADSIKNHGGFAENENAVPLSVKGASSTLNNTDTSGATALHPASSGAVREKQDALGAGADEKGPGGLKPDTLGDTSFSGSHSTQGYAGGPSVEATGAPTGVGTAAKGGSDFGATSGTSGATTADSNISSSATTTSGSSGPAAAAGVRPYVPTAPNYTGTVTGGLASEGTFNPKGANLEDAGETDSIPKTKTFTGDVGGVHDPGRLAEKNFEGTNTEPTQQQGQEDVQGTSTGQYDALQSERA